MSHLNIVIENQFKLQVFQFIQISGNQSEEERMLNIIEHLWQFEVPIIQIFPTVIKQQNNKANYYFYSQNKKRILRKSNNQIESICHYCQEVVQNQSQLSILKFECSNKTQKQQSHNQFQTKQRNFQISLTSYNDMQSSLLHSKNQKCAQQVFVILLPSTTKSNNKVQGICQQAFYKFRITKSKSNVKIIELAKQNILIQSITNQKQTISHEKVKECIQKCFKSIQDMTKEWFFKQHHQQIEISLFSGLVRVDQNYNSIKDINLNFNFRLVWSFDFIIKLQHTKLSKTRSHPILDLFNFSYIPIQKAQEAQTNIIQKDKLQSKQKCSAKIQLNNQKNMLQYSNAHKQQVKCWGCEQTCNNDYKQLSNQDVIMLRKSYSLSIRGINEEYYQVCQNCYNKLDQI